MPRSMQVGSKQSGSKAVHSSALTPLGGAQALPAVGAPTPPSDALSVGPSRGKAPPSTLMVHADGAAQEVRGSPRYLQVLGSYAPPAKQVADALEFASQWYAQQKAADAWRKYVRAQSALAYEHATGQIALLRDGLEVALARDSTVGTDFKALVAFTTAGSTRQSRASVNRKARASAAKRRAGKKAQAEAQAKAQAQSASALVKTA